MSLENIKTEIYWRTTQVYNRINYCIINKNSKQWQDLCCGHDRHEDNVRHDNLENNGANGLHIIVMNQSVKTNTKARPSSRLSVAGSSEEQGERRRVYLQYGILKQISSFWLRAIVSPHQGWTHKNNNRTAAANEVFNSQTELLVASTSLLFHVLDILVQSSSDASTEPSGPPVYNWISFSKKSGAFFQRSNRRICFTICYLLMFS